MLSMNTGVKNSTYPLKRNVGFPAQKVGQTNITVCVILVYFDKSTIDWLGSETKCYTDISESCNILKV